MSITAFTGPVIAFGQTYTGESNPDLSPSMFWGGVSLVDPRQPFVYQPGEAQAAVDFGWLGADNITTVSAVPYTKAAGAIVASANPTGPNLTLVSANSATTGVYITPSITRNDNNQIDTGVNGAGLVAIDSYTTVTGSISGGVLTVTANTAMPITAGMQIVSAANVTAGNPVGVTIINQLTGGSGGQGVAGTYSIDNTTAVSTSGTITLAIPNPLASVVPFGSPGNRGMAMWNPQSCYGRAVAVTAAAGATYTTATVSGYDVYGYPLVEAITLTAGSQVSGKKAFRYIRSVVLSGGTADTTHAYSVDTTDVFGLPLRSDSFGDLTVNYAASLTALTGITAATNYLPSDRTSPATSTTGDVRGTYAAFTSATGANKLVIRQSPQAYNVGSVTGLFGVSQYTNF